MVKEALANGRLTARGADPALTRAARDSGTTEDALALAAALAQPWADLVLSGAATVGQLRSNLAACELAWDDELERRLVGLVEEPADYWSTRSKLPWN
jgi:aryl-alcohol dehydrogenase-like predicted oxidoreductase